MAWNPLVSVITPSFNQGEFIEDTIKSVLEQDYPRIEYIVMDGGSEDDTIQILKRYTDRISWISEPDKGQSDAINKGWRMASGEILAWLNSDDTYTPGAVRAAVEMLEKHPKAGMVYGDALMVDRAGHPLSLYRPGRGGRNRLVWMGQHIPQPTAFMRSVIVRRVGDLDIHMDTKFDYDFFIRMADAAPIVYLPRVQSRIHVYEGTKSSKNIHQNWLEKLSVVQKYNRLWFASWVYIYYFRYLVWRRVPAPVQNQFRKWRGLPRDMVKRI